MSLSNPHLFVVPHRKEIIIGLKWQFVIGKAHCYLLLFDIKVNHCESKTEFLPKVVENRGFDEYILSPVFAQIPHNTEL